MICAGQTMLRSTWNTTPLNPNECADSATIPHDHPVHRGEYGQLKKLPESSISARAPIQLQGAPDCAVTEVHPFVRIDEIGVALDV